MIKLLTGSQSHNLIESLSNSDSISTCEVVIEGEC
jgi:hypothetical protein